MGKNTKSEYLTFRKQLSPYYGRFTGQKLLLVEMYVCVSNHFPSTELIERVQAKTKDQFPKFILRIANKLECLVKNWLSSVAFDFRAVNVGIVWEKLKSHLCRWVLSIPPSCDIQSTHYVNKQM